jgi:adenine-specific DNA methylase/DNA-binding XRE family transcriptional regulator
MDSINIRAIRETLGETQSEFASRFGVSQIAVAHWESGRSKPSAERRQLLASLQSIEAPKVNRSPLTPFRPIQYLGSKLRLAHSIAEIIDEVSPPSNRRVGDLFAGSGVVSHTLAASRPITAVDIQAYSSMLTRGLLQIGTPRFLALNSDQFISEAKKKSKDVIGNFLPLVDLEEEAIELAATGEINLLNEIIERGSLSAFLQRPSPHCPPRLKQALNQSAKSINATTAQIQSSLIASRYFGGAYFSYKQAVALDSIYLTGKELGPEFEAPALAVLLSTASEIVNTVGKQFAQPIKLRKPDGSTPKILLDRTIRDRGLDPFATFQSMAKRWAEAVSASTSAQHKCQRVDVLDFVERDDTCGAYYADPPYTIDHYSRFYHVLETLVLRDQPRLDEMAKNGTPTIMRGIYRQGRHQSAFSIPSTAADAFERLFAAVSRRQVPLVLSYSPFEAAAGHRPRLLALDQLESLAKKYFSNIEVVEVTEHSHRRLTAKALNVPLNVDGERLIVCR